MRRKVNRDIIVSTYKTKSGSFLLVVPHEFVKRLNLRVGDDLEIRFIEEGKEKHLELRKVKEVRLIYG